MDLYCKNSLKGLHKSDLNTNQTQTPHREFTIAKYAYSQRH